MHSQLLELPAELRNEICRLVVVKPFITLNSAGRIPLAMQPALSRVNKQLREETLPIFYGENTLGLDFSLRDNRGRPWLGEKNKLYETFRRWSTGIQTKTSMLRNLRFLNIDYEARSRSKITGESVVTTAYVSLYVTIGNKSSCPTPAGQKVYQVPSLKALMEDEDFYKLTRFFLPSRRNQVYFGGPLDVAYVMLCNMLQKVDFSELPVSVTMHEDFEREFKELSERRW